MRIRPTLAERMWSKFERADGCWIWTGGRSTSGYGKVSLGRRGSSGYAHRVMYELIVEPIPDGWCIDHLCRNKLCVNPSHLEVVTYSVNVLRGLRSALKPPECSAGHPRIPANLIRNGLGSTRCRLCNIDRHRAYRQKEKS